MYLLSYNSYLSLTKGPMQTNKTEFYLIFSVLIRKLRQFKHGSFFVDLLIIIENTIFTLDTNKKYVHTN